MTQKRDLQMTISLNALEHLGLNLYSSVPAVLSEVVANAWDADAKKVDVVIDSENGTISITDDGCGMSRDQVIDRFLTVGFKRRAVLGKETPKGRRPMGRKGIGKLSVFSIAETAHVYTSSAGEHTAFVMDLNAIKEAITGSPSETYSPRELGSSPDSELPQGGTRIVLSNLEKRFNSLTAEYLKRRIARRFSVIGGEDFQVTVNGQLVTPSDRGYQNAIQYLWTYGSKDGFPESCDNLESAPEDRATVVTPKLEQAGITLSGWIGTVEKPSQLSDEEGENLNRIAIFMRGKLAQEDILDGFGEKEIYADYIIGELHCDELDSDDDGDIATSSRQALKEDAPRFVALREIVQSELRHIAREWKNLRRTSGAKSAMKVPEVANWLERQKGEDKRKAERWIGRLNTIRTGDDRDKRELMKASIIAFETFHKKRELEQLAALEDRSLADTLKVFRSVDDLEMSFYGEIVKLRMSVIDALQEQLDENELEAVIQDYIYDHLWLLDPSWERADSSAHSEAQVETFLSKNTDSLTDEQRRGRIDLAYKTVAGKHVIIELKRASVRTDLDELVAQIRKYRDGVKKVLRNTNDPSNAIEIICLVGRRPKEWDDVDGTGPQGVEDALKNVDARIMLYDELISQAKRTYSEYLTVHKKMNSLSAIFDAIDNFDADEG